jgi:uncharacterized protein (DUF58 family)
VKIGLVAGFLLAAYLRSAPLFFILCAVLFLSICANLWLRAIAGRLRVSRAMESRLFFGERTTVTVTFVNGSGLPIPWLAARESLPLALRLANTCSEVFALGALGQASMRYTLVGARRGLYPLGPLTVSLGDVFGLVRRDLFVAEPRYMLVYPRMLAAEDFDLPALALFGDIRTRRWTPGDPARIAGLRDYQPGDSLRQIHWPATAAAGSLQIKQHEPATTIQTLICLETRRSAYGADAASATELAITLAATIANRLVDRRQEVGVITNGVLTLPDGGVAGVSPSVQAVADTLAFADGIPLETADAPAGLVVAPAPIRPAKGRAHLMRVLELLARLETSDGDSVLRDLDARSLGLPWGSTLVVITGTVNDEVFITLHRLRQAGLLVVLILVSRTPANIRTVARARSVGVVLHSMWLDIPALVLSA